MLFKVDPLHKRTEPLDDAPLFHVSTRHSVESDSLTFMTFMRFAAASKASQPISPGTSVL